MTDYRVELAELQLPDFGLPTVEPEIPAEIYEQRLSALRKRCIDEDYDLFVIYGDREHFANMAYITGYDPRFEEALFIAPSDSDIMPTLIVGNEGIAYSVICPLEINRVLYQPFSLISQPRDQTQPLAQVLEDAGLRAGMRVATAGWKYFDRRETPDPRQWNELPAFIVATLHEIGCEVENRTDLFMHPTDGLRTTNEVEQLAVFEFMATYSSQGIRNMIFNARPGLTELELTQTFGLNGLPLCYHPTVFSGERARLALASPANRRLAQGDPIFAAVGYRGCNTARGGFLVHSADELPGSIRDYVEKLVAPYFRAVVDWYEHIGIGVKGDELYDLVHQHIGDPFFGVSLNPGHLVHLDEWVSSPIYANSSEELRSGMAIQADIIPATGTEYFTTNIEDTIALADENLRNAFSTKYPEAMKRIQQRRAFMRNTLGIRLKPEVLPFSNIPAYLPPFWLSPKRAMKVA